MDNVLEITEKLLKKFRLNIEQIKRCSDNTIEDLRNEAFIVVFNNLDSIQSNERIFINKLKTKCLKFNKYGKRIESKDLFNKFNLYEENMIKDKSNELDFDEDKLCLLLSIQHIIGRDNYNFLLDYYSNGGEFTSIKHNISKELTRKRVSNLLKEIRDKL